MRIALLTDYRINRKEPLAVLLERIHKAFLAAGLGEPDIRFSFSDPPLPRAVSSVERILKRHPELECFRTDTPVLPGGPPIRQITNLFTSAPVKSVSFAAVLAIAVGVPRSFPLHNFAVQLHSSAFGEPTRDAALMPGVKINDSWWVNGRQRLVSALTIVEADPTAKKLPAPTESLAIVLEACGKAAKTVQVPLVGSATAEAPAQPVGPSSDVREAIATIVRDYRARLAEIIDQAVLPHDLPPTSEAWSATSPGETPGPKKPALERAFRPMGYDCRGGSGTFALRRRTPGNLTVEVSLDVGTWSNSIIGFYRVHGIRFTARLPLPVSKRATTVGQYPIGNAERWQKIVENLAALVAEYDRTFVPAVEAAAGPAPAWFRPES